MTVDRTILAPLRSANSPEGPAPESSDGGILEQAQAFSQIARAAYNDCQHGQSAVEELRRRRNRSGE